MASLVQTSRNIAAAGLTANDLTAYCGFIWSFMFEKLAPGAHPSGRLILISDMRDVKLGQAVGEGQVSCCSCRGHVLLVSSILLCIMHACCIWLDLVTLARVAG